MLLLPTHNQSLQSPTTSCQELKELRSITQEISFLTEEKGAANPILVVYDHKLAGESVTNPRQRVPPLRENHLQKCLSAYLEVHNAGGDRSQTHLHPADEFVLYCGGKPGLIPALQKPFEKRKKEVKMVTLMYSRDDMQCRREKTQGGAINQIEQQLRITAEVYCKPLKQGANYKCWNDGNGFGPIRLPAWGGKDTMMATRAEKKEIFVERRLAVGGVGRIVEDPVHEPPQAKRARLAASADEIEPVFYHCPCKQFFEDEFTMSNCSALVDFTAGQGYLLHCAVSANVPSIGFCISAEHKERLRVHLLSLTLQDMCAEGSDCYEPRFDNLLKEHGDAEGLPDPKKTPQKPKAAPKKRGGKRGGRKEDDPAAEDSEKSEEPEEPKEPEEPREPEAPADPAKPLDPAEQKLLAMLAKMNGAKNK